MRDVATVSTMSVVVPATDAPATLPQCIDAIRRADASIELIVVDAPEALSAAAARNAGASRAGGDIVVFVDADVAVHRDALDRVRTTLDERPELTAVFGSYDDAPHHPSTVSAFRNLLHHHVHQCNGGDADTFWSGLGAIRRERFLAVGGFDQLRYPHPSVEDVELGRRLHRHGERIELDPAIQGTHLKRWTLRSMVATDFARRGVPWVAMQLRDRQLSASLNCGWRHRASAAACAVVVVAALGRRPVPAVTALAALVGLNAGFYRLLRRRLGRPGALVGIGLHALHHLVAIAAVPAGVAVAVLEGGRDDRHAAPAPIGEPPAAADG